MGYVYIDDKYEPYLELMLDCVKLHGEDIDKQVKRIVKDTKTMDECLEDNFLAFKLHSKNVRDEYEKAVTECIDKSCDVWLKCDELIASSKPKIDKASKELEYVEKLICSIEKRLDSLSIYKVEKMIDLVEKFKRMPAEEKQLFAKLLEC